MGTAKVFYSGELRYHATLERFFLLRKCRLLLNGSWLGQWVRGGAVEGFKLLGRDEEAAFDRADGLIIMADGLVEALA